MPPFYAGEAAGGPFSDNDFWAGKCGLCVIGGFADRKSGGLRRAPCGEDAPLVRNAVAQTVTDPGIARHRGRGEALALLATGGPIDPCCLPTSCHPAVSARKRR